jgi:hypothetical protein
MILQSTSICYFLLTGVREQDLLIGLTLKAHWAVEFKRLLWSLLDRLLLLGSILKRGKNVVVLAYPSSDQL